MSLERIIPDDLAPGDPFAQGVLELHLERYRFAARWAQDARVLDIACGVGYGSEAFMTAGARAVIGVDRDPRAVAYARRRYGGEAVTFRVSDAEVFSDDEPFDLVVSLETVEHVPDPVRFLRTLADLVRPGGHLVASVPTSPSTDINPYHLHDFTERSFRELIAETGMLIVEACVQVQSVALKTLLTSRGRARPALAGLALLYLRSPDLLWRRVRWVARHGLSNRYLILVARRPAH